jgi:hypothetical protein
MTILEKVLQLRPIQFRYVRDVDPEQRLRAGFSAQQVQEVFPQAVVEVNGHLVLDLRVLGDLIDEARKERSKGKS